MLVLLRLIALMIILDEVDKVDFSSPMKHTKNACTCSREKRYGFKRMLIGSARSDNHMSSPEIVLGVTFIASVPDVEIFMMGSSPN